MTIMADPTFMMTRRGQEWLRRAAVNARPYVVRCSRAYVAATSSQPSPGGHDPYWLRSALATRTPDRRLYGDMPNMLNLVSWQPDTVASLRLDRFQSPDVEVIGDIWSGLVAGDWLVARRPVTFDALVQAGVTIVTYGPGDYHDAFATATSDLTVDLAEALDRRIRFIANVIRQGDRFGRPALSLYDSGRGAYR